ncbi:MAG: hypothetical protein RR573_02745 [Oscillospiraceae bacterium]
MKTRDITKRFFFVSLILIVIAKLLIGLTQNVFLTPYTAPIDDMLMFNAANSITQGQWLGQYNWLTLSKYYFFAIWLAMLNILHIPYLLGGQILWLCTVAVCTIAFSPILKKYIFKLLFFAVLLFNPAQMAAEVELRVYRDNIFPALCLICISGFIGAALRCKKPFSQYIGFLLVAAVGLATACTTREDGIWLLPLAIGACITIIIFVCITKGLAHKALRIISLAVPYAAVGCLVLVFCCINYNYYGRFVFSDYTSKEFKDAYGAMSRVKHEDWEMQIVVPKDVRTKLYDNVPELKILEPILEHEWFYARYGHKRECEFGTGGFHWALREAAYDAGIYSSANNAAQYWRTVADKINELCDNGTLEAGPRRSSTTPPIRSEYILPTIKEGFSNLWRVLTFKEAEPAFKIMSFVDIPDYDSFIYFLRNTPNNVAMENTDLPYFSPSQRLANTALTALSYIYAILLPLMFVCAIIWQILATVQIFKRKSKLDPIFYILMLGVLLCILLRAFMIAFMFVASFNKNIVHIMYLSSIHPLAIIYSVLGSGMLVYNFIHRKARKKGETIG